MPVRRSASALTSGTSHRALVLGQGPQEVSMTGMIDLTGAGAVPRSLATMPIK